MRVFAAALVLLAAGCSFDVIGFDVDGGGGGGSGSGGGADMSSGDLAGSGGAGGGDLSLCSQCPAGCGGTPTHCLALAPTGPVTANDYNLPGIQPQSLAGDININTDDGSISGAITRKANMPLDAGIGWHVVMQQGGPAVSVFSVGSLSLPTGHKITIRGANAFALASAGDITIAGTVDGACSGPALTPGPGGYTGGMPGMDGNGPATGGGAGKAGATGAAGVTGSSGGGGAGYGDAGGQGGLITTQLSSNGGTPWGELTSTMFTLVGGPGGGGGGNNGGHGGGGGGALQLVANGTINIAATGVINVGACGGAIGGGSKGGGGGGAGGAIVLEAIHVTLASGSVLAANGGGGGSGDAGGMPGANANASVTPAPGGQPKAASTTGGAGGDGGASNGMPGQHYTSGRSGTIPDSTLGFGGGGGGGVGRIAIRALNPTTGGISDSSSSVTPDPADTNVNGAHPTVYGAASFQ